MKHKYVYALILFITVGGLAAGFLLVGDRTNDRVVTASCSDSAGAATLYAGVDDTTELVSTSSLIVYGQAVVGGFPQPNKARDVGVAPQILVQQVIKGREVGARSRITLCANDNLPTIDTATPTMMLCFFLGRDGAVWVPQQGGLGIVPADSSGHFDLRRVVRNRGSVVSVSDVQALVH